MSCPQRAASTDPIASTTGAKMFGTCSRKPRPPARSGWVGTSESSSFAIRWNSDQTNTIRQNHATSSARWIGRATYRNQSAPKPRPSPLVACSMPQLTSCDRWLNSATTFSARMTPSIAIQGSVASRTRAAPARAARKAGICESSTSPERTKCGRIRIVIAWAGPSARISSGIATRQRTCTPKWPSRGSSASGGTARPSIHAHTATGTHASNDQKIARRTSPRPPAGINPTFLWRRKSTSPRTIESRKSS